LLQEKRPEIEAAALAEAHQRFRWKGVAEAVLGAFAWTVILIVGSLLLVWAKPDILEYLRTSTELFPNNP
jgi:hypothetical protein